MAKHLSLALAGALAACYGPDVPFGAPCLQDIDCPSGQTCNPETSRCEGETEILTWRDDTADDFAAAGSFTGGVAIEKEGFVGPVAYFGGGLRLSGIDDHVIPNEATPWNELAGKTRSGTSFARTVEIDYSTGTPVGLGLSGSNNITVLVEGEVHLEKIGDWMFQLEADQLGFVELAPPGSSTFQRVVTTNDVNEGRYNVAEIGWHRIRGAFADNAGDMHFLLKYRDPNAQGNGFKQIPIAKLRAPAGDIEGYLVDGFDDTYLLAPEGTAIHAGTLAGQTFGADPLGLPVGDNTYSLRFAGQILIDVEGEYAFLIESNDGHRVWIDGVEVANQFGTSPGESTTMPRMLEPGWHDFVVDLNRDGGGSAQLDVTVDSGPTWVGEGIPLDHVRPVVGRATRWASGVWTGGPATIPDTNTPISRSVTLEVPDGMSVARVDGVFEVNHMVQSSLDIKLRFPSGSTTTLLSPNTVMGDGVYRSYFARSSVATGTSWSIVATDTVAEGSTGQLNAFALTLTGRAEPAPFETSYHYVSAPRDLGAVASLTHVRWGLRQARMDVPVIVSLRTCDSAEACAEEPWTQVADGARPEVPVRRFAQYMVQLAADGDVPTALDWFELGYRAYAGD